MTARKRAPLHVYAELKPALQWVEELFHQTVCAPQHQCFSGDFLARIKVFLVKEAVDALSSAEFAKALFHWYLLTQDEPFPEDLILSSRKMYFRKMKQDIRRCPV